MHHVNGPFALHCSALDSFIPPRVRSFARDSSEPLPNRRRRVSLRELSQLSLPESGKALARDIYVTKCVSKCAYEFNNRDNTIYRFSSSSSSSLELYLPFSISRDVFL